MNDRASLHIPPQDCAWPLRQFGDRAFVWQHQLEWRVASPEGLLDHAKDRDSFIAFVKALANKRAEAARTEPANPQAYLVDGAHNWKNAEIADFLFAALTYFEPKPLRLPEAEPNWRMFADFL